MGKLKKAAASEEAKTPVAQPVNAAPAPAVPVKEKKVKPVKEPKPVKTGLMDSIAKGGYYKSDNPFKPTVVVCTENLKDQVVETFPGAKVLTAPQSSGFPALDLSSYGPETAILIISGGGIIPWLKTLNFPMGRWQRATSIGLEYPKVVPKPKKKKAKASEEAPKSELVEEEEESEDEEEEESEE